ncbi:MAG TPA: H-NS histone family protein [Candidatus Competibacteraceae bacterium]|nr:H-NS histone family protein [Candidatus Competibacteraceae bacterium]
MTEDSLDDLIEVKARVEQEIRQRAKAELVALESRRAALLALLEEDPGVPAKNPAKAPVVSFPKYRDPATGKTWSGKGKRPQWFDADRAEDFLIAQNDLLAA